MNWSPIGIFDNAKFPLILIKGIDGHCDNVILIHHPGSHHPQIPKSSLIYTLDVFTASLSPKQLNIALKVHMKKHRDIDQRRIDGHNDNDQLIHIQGCFSSPSDPRWAGRVGLFWTGFHSMSVWVGGLEGETALNVDIIKQPHKISIHIPSSSLYIPDHPLRCVIPAASDWEEEGGRGIILDRMRQDFLPTNLTICSTAK